MNKSILSLFQIQEREVKENPPFTLLRSTSYNAQIQANERAEKELPNIPFIQNHFHNI